MARLILTVAFQGVSTKLTVLTVNSSADCTSSAASSSILSSSSMLSMISNSSSSVTVGSSEPSVPTIFVTAWLMPENRKLTGVRTFIKKMRDPATRGASVSLQALA